MRLCLSPPPGKGHLQRVGGANFVPQDTTECFHFAERRSRISVSGARTMQWTRRTQKVSGTRSRSLEKFKNRYYFCEYQSYVV